MSRWIATVVVESAVLAVLVVIGFDPGSTATHRSGDPPDAGGSGAAQALPGPAPSAGTVEEAQPAAGRGNDPTPISTAAFREAETGSIPYQASDPAGIVVHGRIIGDRPLPESGVLWLIPGAGEPIVSFWDVSHTYAQAGLRPGTWKLSIRVPGVFDHEETLQLSESPNPLRHDLHLRAIPVIEVSVVTPEGQPFADEAGKVRAGAGSELRVWPTREPPDPVAIAADPSLLARYETGVWFERASLRHLDRPLAPACIGVFQPKVAGHLFLSLVHGQRILATRRVETKALDVGFTIAVAEFAALFGPVRLRPVSAEEGQPLPDLSLLIDDTGYMVRVLPRAADGTLTVEKVPAGRHILVLGAEGREQIERRFETRGKQPTDLGTIPLRPAATIAVRVTSATGQPAPATIEVHRLDGDDDRSWPRRSSEARTDAHGTLTLKNLPPCRFLVAAWSHESGYARAEIETVAATTTEAALHMAPATEVTLVPARDDIYGVTVVVRDGAGLPLFRRPAERLFPLRLRLPAGGYRVELRRKDQIQVYPLAVASEPVTLELGR